MSDPISGHEFLHWVMLGALALGFFMVVGAAGRKTFLWWSDRRKWKGLGLPVRRKWDTF